MPITINAGYDTKNAKTVETVVAELVKAHGRQVVAGVTDLTDNSGGTAGTLAKLAVALENEANSSTSLAQKAAAEAALNTVKDALLELATKANAYATLLGLPTITYNGGGTAADGTVAAVTVAVTAATTGAQADETNAVLEAFNNAFYNIAALTNKLARATGKTELDLAALKGETVAATVAAISVDTGTAADPGVTKAALDAELVKARANVATLAEKLNELNAGLGNAAVVAV